MTGVEINLNVEKKGDDLIETARYSEGSGGTAAALFGITFKLNVTADA